MVIPAFLACFLLLTACIGGPYGVGGESFQDKLNKMFVGMPRDAVIIKYGSPNRTTKLDMGIKIMEYRSSTTEVQKGGVREKERCTLRLWYKTTTILYVDYLGYDRPCVNLVYSNERDGYYDLRH